MEKIINYHNKAPTTIIISAKPETTLTPIETTLGISNTTKTQHAHYQKLAHMCNKAYRSSVPIKIRHTHAFVDHFYPSQHL